MEFVRTHYALGLSINKVLHNVEYRIMTVVKQWWWSATKWKKNLTSLSTYLEHAQQPERPQRGEAEGSRALVVVNPKHLEHGPAITIAK